MRCSRGNIRITYASKNKKMVVGGKATEKKLKRSLKIKFGGGKEIEGVNNNGKRLDPKLRRKGGLK